MDQPRRASLPLPSAASPMRYRSAADRFTRVRAAATARSRAGDRTSSGSSATTRSPIDLRPCRCKASATREWWRSGRRTPARFGPTARWPAGAAMVSDSSGAAPSVAILRLRPPYHRYSAARGGHRRCGRDRSGAVSYMRRPRHRGAPLLGAQRLPAARGRHDAGSAEPRHRSRGRIRRGRRRGGRADVHVHPHCSGQRSVLGRQQPRRARRRHLRRSARARVRSATASLRDSGNQWRGRAGRGQHSRLRRRCQRATGVLGQ